MKGQDVLAARAGRAALAEHLDTRIDWIVVGDLDTAAEDALAAPPARVEPAVHWDAEGDPFEYFPVAVSAPFVTHTACTRCGIPGGSFVESLWVQ